MLRAHVIILELRGLRLRRLQGFLQIAPRIGIAPALHLVPAGELRLQIRLQPFRRHADAPEQFRHQTLRLPEQRQQQMLAIQFLMRPLPRQPLRVLQRLLRFDGQFVELHPLSILRNPRFVKPRNVFSAGFGRSTAVLMDFLQNMDFAG